MPGLDVSFVVNDPLLADTFSVERRTDLVGENGRTTPTPVEFFPAITGVVTQQDPGDLLRRDDSQIVPRRIFIAAQFPFRNASRNQDGSVQYQPDRITWPVDPSGQPAAGATVYTVEEAFPYSRYGAGFHECVCAAQNAVDPEQP